MKYLLTLIAITTLTGCGTTPDRDRIDDIIDIIEDRLDERREDDSPQPGPEPEPDEENLPFMSACPGASGTFLWKPHAETTGKLIVLTDGRRRPLVDRVEIGRPDPQFSERGSLRRTQERCVNGGRPHWMFNRHGRDYTGPLWFREYLKDGRVYEYYIPDPGQRYELRSGQLIKGAD